MVGSPPHFPFYIQTLNKFEYKSSKLEWQYKEEIHATMNL